MDSFAGLFDGFHYIFTGESTSKADKFDNLRLMEILNTPLTQKGPGIRTKRPEQEQNLQTKRGAISRPWRMNPQTFYIRAVCFALFLLNRYWGIVTVPGSFLQVSVKIAGKLARRTDKMLRKSGGIGATGLSTLYVFCGCEHVNSERDKWRTISAGGLRWLVDLTSRALR